MSGVLEAICRRRSIRKYTGDPLEEGQLDAILQAGLLAPTSQNRRPWTFVAVQDREVLTRLAYAKKAGAAMIGEAAAAIVVTVDGDNIDTWVEDESIALAYMHLVASDLGLGSCWVQMHLRAAAGGMDSEQAVREALGLEREQRVVGVLAVGQPAQKLPARNAADADFSQVIYV